MTHLLHTTRAWSIFLALMLSTSILGQNNLPLLFKSGQADMIASDELSKNVFFAAKESRLHDNYAIIQFSEIPMDAIKQNLKEAGINLLGYLPKNAYYAQILPTANWEVLAKSNLHSVVEIKSHFKLSKSLHQKAYPDWATKNDQIALNGVYFKTERKEYISNLLLSIGAKDIAINDANVCNFTIDIEALDHLYALPPFYFFETIDAPSKPENLVGVTNHRSNTLATSYDNGLKLDGSGVTVMLQDNSRLDEHIDYTGRFINNGGASNSGDHGEHCGGTIAGAGNLDPLARGMAYGAEVLVYSPSDNNYNSVPNLVTNSNLTITSKSYGGGLNVGYNTLARTLDQQIRNYPELIHVFSAGNSNGSGFTVAGSQWFNITGGHKSAKNVLAVGNLTFQDVIANSSSRGPSEDGRIKPDICAVGTNVYSTIDPNTYGNKTGTSMACPGVAGTLAQLYQGYKELNNGNNPDAALMKGAILNTADDLGNSGPDFIYGWGRINARRAYNVISNNQYFTDDISQGDNLTHSITVPAGTAQLKVMVYWSDFEASTSASQVLVNDINMSLTSPTGAMNLPWTLDNTPNSTALNSSAVTAIDDVNNVEQITIDNPQAGNYSVNLNGFAIPSGPQKYFVVYEFVSDDIVLTYPIGGEGFDPNRSEVIRWDALNDNGTFTLEYSTNNGLSWTTISNNIQADRRYYSWNVPAVVTGEALIRVSRGTQMSQSHETFSIIGVPVGLTVLSVCPDSVELSWTPVTNATGYEVSMLGSLYMDSVATSTASSVTIAHSSTNDFWWSVKALGANDCVGRRARAKYQSSGTFNCTFNTDVSLEDDQSIDGRDILSCMEADDLEIGITIVNSGFDPVSNIPVSYQLNSSPAVNETYVGTLQPNTSVYYPFTNQPSIPFGTNTLTLSANYAGDQNINNNTVVSTFEYINATPLSLPFSEDFETFATCNTTSNCEVEVCQLANNFINSRNGVVDDIDWRTNNGGTTSGTTGPTMDYKPGTNVGKYLYLEPSGTPTCANKASHLISPCLIIDDGALLTFAYHMYGQDMGELHLDVFVNGNWVNDVMPQLSGDQGDNWIEQAVDLNAYAGEIINLRFRGVTGSGYRSDMAIDDINVTSTLRVESNSAQNKFQIYPNPSSGLFFYEIDNSENAAIQVMDTNGKLIFSTQTPTSKGEIDLSKAASGIYFVRVVVDNHTSVEKIIID